MNRTEHLLIILAEECAEVAQRASKAVRFGMEEVRPGSTEHNARGIEREMGDLMAVFEMLGLRIWEDDKDAKIARVKKYMEYSRQLGTLDREA